MNRRTVIAALAGLIGLAVVVLVMGDKTLPLLIGGVLGVIVAVPTGLALMRIIDKIWP